MRRDGRMNRNEGGRRKSNQEESAVMAAVSLTSTLP